MADQTRPARELDAEQMLAIYLPIVRDMETSFESEPSPLKVVFELVELTLGTMPWPDASQVCLHDG
jgi:hypothetical protein